MYFLKKCKVSQFKNKILIMIILMLQEEKKEVEGK